MKKLWIVLLAMLLLCGCTAEAKTPEPENYAVSFDPQHSVFLSEMVATDQLAYYQSTRNHICAYDHNGAYKFCISFTATQNGGLKMQAVDHWLYVLTPQDSFYIFENDRLIERMSKEDAAAEGYITENYYWSDSNVKRSDFTSFTMTDGSNRRIQLPAGMIRNQVISLLTPVVLVLLAFALYALRRRHNKETHMKRPS